MVKFRSCERCRLLARSGTCWDRLLKVNAGGSAIFIRNSPLRNGCVPGHEATHAGRDHDNTVNSENGILMLASVHFKPNSTPRELRTRLHAIRAPLARVC